MSLRYVTHVFSVRWCLTIAVMYFEVTDVFRQRTGAFRWVYNAVCSGCLFQAQQQCARVISFLTEHQHIIGYSMPCSAQDTTTACF